MKWLGRRESNNVEDRRSMSGGKVALGGGIIGIIFLIIQTYMSGDPTQLINAVTQNNSSNNNEQPTTAADDEMAKYVSVVLADNEDVWNAIFTDMNSQYEEPKLVLFRGSVETACGGASAASGPFYCPADKKVYMDLGFFEELKNRFGAKGGDFAVAYVIAHEVGHHVQNLMGTSGKVQERKSELSEKEGNKLSVALELQADFYAGIWAHYNQKTKNVLEEGDIEEALSAANAVGDDHLQKQAQGHITLDAFTHGTSEQRMYWFKRGYESGDLAKGNTFKELKQ
ncbi:MAG: neutral zinc metallopeptidase [Bacteroidia bacterium]